MAGGTRQGASTRTRAGLLSRSDTLGMMPSKEDAMPRYEATCPDCGHVTDVTCTIETWRTMQPLICSCGAKKRQAYATALAPGRKTEGKA